MIVYGIPNCNSVKKARDWFALNNLAVDFHDYKKLGISRQKLIEWSKLVGWELLLNKKGTTWKSISLEEQKKIKNQSSAIDLMLDKTSLIKRPVVEYNNRIWIGFDEKLFEVDFK